MFIFVSLCMKNVLLCKHTHTFPPLPAVLFVACNKKHRRERGECVCVFTKQYIFHAQRDKYEHFCPILPLSFCFFHENSKKGIMIIYRYAKGISFFDCATLKNQCAISHQDECSSSWY
mmetsp:Transcript_56310/g.83722  ORF Transcript_56310/g.83722 Transcript_56310/m.83722 type:complete len:118 (-) Transcript_56310:396-749(-)